MLAGSENRAVAVIFTAGELKNEQYFPCGVAYIWTHKIYDNAVVKKVHLRYYDRRPQVRVVEPIVEEPGMRFQSHHRGAQRSGSPRPGSTPEVAGCSR